MGDRQQQPARSRRVLQDDQNRSFGPTGPNCAAIYPKCRCWWISARPPPKGEPLPQRSEEHTSELQSLMRISYAVFCLKKKKQHNKPKLIDQHITSNINPHLY